MKKAVADYVLGAMRVVYDNENNPWRLMNAFVKTPAELLYKQTNRRLGRLLYIESKLQAALLQAQLISI